MIGAVAPSDVWTDDEGLHIKGWIDTSDSLGKRLFRMVKRGVLSWSVGFSLANSRKTADGVRELLEVGELYEISAVVTPANEATRTTGAKRDAPSVEELKQWERELGLDPEFERVRASARDRC